MVWLHTTTEDARENILCPFGSWSWRRKALDLLCDIFWWMSGTYSLRFQVICTMPNLLSLVRINKRWCYGTSVMPQNGSLHMYFLSYFEGGVTFERTRGGRQHALFLQDEGGNGGPRLMSNAFSKIRGRLIDLCSQRTGIHFDIQYWRNRNRRSFIKLPSKTCIKPMPHRMEKIKNYFLPIRLP
jgi:hypothetical protein